MERSYYESIAREVRLKAVFHSMDHARRHDSLLRARTDYTKEEQSRIRKTMEENRDYLLIGDEAYPKKLYDMSWPPLLLFYQGEVGLLKRPSVGLVGSRNNSLYGSRVTKELAISVAGTGGVIVSGGARGVDSIAHRSTLSESGKTICILGNGMDISYPPENCGLFAEIREKGLILSEYPRGYGPQKWTFPMRNRIIAALSDVIIVTEAAEKSGSLHTATFGEEYNRRVYAVPSGIFSETGRGTNSLIEMGARILYRKESFLEDFRAAFPLALYYRISDLGLLGVALERAALQKLFSLTKEDLDSHLMRFRMAKVIGIEEDGRITFL